MTKVYSTAFAAMRAAARISGRAAWSRRWFVFDSLSSEYAKSFFDAFQELKAYEKACKVRGHKPRLTVVQGVEFPGYVGIFDGQVLVAECVGRALQ